MISHQEVMNFSREFGLSANIIEKDYVLGWLLGGISNHHELSKKWVFKGGTCLKKCYFETYRFSEDLDFTITSQEHINQNFLTDTFKEIANWVYDNTGIEIPKDKISFEVFNNPRGGISVEGKISYKGPLQPGGDLPRIKLDLTSDEVLVLNSVSRAVHHPYSDKPPEGIYIHCYCFEELLAEKIRALGERLRPRDLYDVIHLYRHDDIKPDHTVLCDTLKKKCEFKSIQVPSMEMLENKPEWTELQSEWENMLAHQLPTLPSFEQFWKELPVVLNWLYHAIERVIPQSMPVVDASIDETWYPPTMAQPWNISVPFEMIRFAAANRLCVNLAYNNTYRLIEPYLLRRTRNGNLLLYAVKHNTGEVRAYRIDRIQGCKVTNEMFTPRYAIELTASGPISSPPIYRSSVYSGSKPQSTKSKVGPTYIIECPYCRKRFYRKGNNTKLNPHKDKSGYKCSGPVQDI